MLDMYWEYAGTRYKHKFQVIDAAHGNLSDISFHIFSDAYFSYDFSKEPALSYDELLKQRALQLRDKYKYIKLFFSGGQDSITMLNAFKNNNIFIDEIITYRFGSEKNASNKEADLYAIPYLKKHFSNSKTKITVYENDLAYFDKYIGEKWLYTRSSMSLRHFNIPKINGKNFCNLFGYLDPKVYYENGKYYSKVFDSDFLELIQFKNIELFFTSDDFLDLHAKQLHLVKNFIKYHPRKEDLIDLYHNEPKTYDDTVKRCCRDEPLFSRIYNKYNPMNLTLMNEKDKLVYAEFTSHIKDRFKWQLSTKVGNQLLYRLYGFSQATGQICLGE